jgi:hypothetical protein
MDAGADPPFEANVQIGTRFRFIDRNGTATIGGGRLTLKRENGEAGDVKRLQKGRQLTGAFLRVVEAEGGHLGKP